MTTTLTTLAAKAPAYCSSGHGVLTPSQWKTCWDAGWSQPTTGAAHAGAAIGHYAAPGLVFLAVIVLVLWAMSKTGSRSTAAQRS